MSWDDLEYFNTDILGSGNIKDCFTGKGFQIIMLNYQHIWQFTTFSVDGREPSLHEWKIIPEAMDPVFILCFFI